MAFLRNYRQNEARMTPGVILPIILVFIKEIVSIQSFLSCLILITSLIMAYVKSSKIKIMIT